MTADNENSAGVPIHPSIGQFSGFEPLLDLFHCWQRARGDRLIPTKRDFEGVMLEYPEMLPSLTLVEVTPSNEFQFLYVGADLVERRKQDLTHLALQEAIAEKVTKFTLEWLVAIFEKPCIVVSTTRTELPGGVGAVSINMTAVLSDESDRPRCIVNMSSYDEAFSKTENIEGYLIGSAGIAVTPIDIGLGVPDLPRTIE